MQFCFGKIYYENYYRIYLEYKLKLIIQVYVYICKFVKFGFNDLFI